MSTTGKVINYVFGAIAELQDGNGSPLSGIIDIVSANIKNDHVSPKPKNIAAHILRAIQFGLEEGFIVEPKKGRYKIPKNKEKIIKSQLPRCEEEPTDQTSCEVDDDSGSDDVEDKSKDEKDKVTDADGDDDNDDEEDDDDDDDDEDEDDDNDEEDEKCAPCQKPKSCCSQKQSSCKRKGRKSCRSKCFNEPAIPTCPSEPREPCGPRQPLPPGCPRCPNSPRRPQCPEKTCGEEGSNCNSCSGRRRSRRSDGFNDHDEDCDFDKDVPDTDHAEDEDFDQDVDDFDDGDLGDFDDDECDDAAGNDGEQDAREVKICRRITKPKKSEEITEKKKCKRRRKTNFSDDSDSDSDSDDKNASKRKRRRQNNKKPCDKINQLSRGNFPRNPFEKLDSINDNKQHSKRLNFESGCFSHSNEDCHLQINDVDSNNDIPMEKDPKKMQVIEFNKN